MNYDFVESFEIDLTTSCNLRCPLCTRNYAHAQHMIDPKYSEGRPLHKIIAQLDKYPNLKECQLAGAISEPTMYKDLFGFLEYLKSRKIFVEMFTNGSLKGTTYWKKIATMLTNRDRIHFTVCGSTQELHEKYRVGSKLNKVLRNAAAVRSIRKIDFGQFIRFEYNKDDLNSPEMQKILKRFSFHYIVDTEGDRRLNEKVVEVPEGVCPVEPRKSLIKQIFKNRPPQDEDACILCNSLKNRKIHINADGSISPCYILAEFSNVKFDDDFDYSAILNYEYPECFLCERRTKLFIRQMGLDFIC